MYVVVRQYKAKPGAVEEIARQAKEGFIPLIKEVPGYVAHYGVKVGTDGVMTVSIFEDQRGAEQSSRLAAQWIEQHIAFLYEGPPQVTAGEVVWP